jgi:hypothetical protein
VRVRTDGRAPVLTVQTESDVTGVLAGVTAGWRAYRTRVPTRGGHGCEEP